MRIHSAFGVALAVAGFAAGALPAAAQEIVDAAPSSTQAVAAGDVATVAVAQINDKQDAAQAAAKVELYKQLMELNGTSRTIRNTLASAKTTTRLVVVQRVGEADLTPEQDALYNQIADTVLKQTEVKLIDDIAGAQSQSFSADEIQQLIAANSSVAAAKYNSAKFIAPDANAAQVQQYMTDALIKIVKTFNESLAG
ncbi:MAG: hypothetical protein WDN06_14650 [Asticcacaulis sp.]